MSKMKEEFNKQREKDYVMGRCDDLEKWRPDNWIGQPHFCAHCLKHQDGLCAFCIEVYESGASDILKALMSKIVN